MAEELEDFIEAAGLLAYDPAAIRRIYQNSPNRLIRRLWQTLIPIGLFLLGIGVDKLFGELKKEEKVKKRAKEFASLLVELGPAFIKAGQALSTRPDIVPKVVLEELSQLQDQLPGFDGKLAMACIEEDFGKPAKEIFAEIEKEPISAASLGQVHKAILKNGIKVAVKIQRPGLREQITLDLYIVRNIANWLKKYIKLIRSDLVALIDELGTRVFEEMDYMNEASNAERFKVLHKENKRISVPKIFREATSRRVLTMEWIDGVKLTEIEAIKKTGIDPDEMIEVGVNCSLQQLLEHGFFHADPHPGNLLALSDGRLCYLDFGMMSEVTKESRTGLIQAVVHLVNRNFDKLSNDFVKLGFLSENIDLNPIIPAFEKVFSGAIEMGVDKMDFKNVTDDMSGVMYKFPFKVPPYYALIIRSLITLEGIALSVDPNFKILGAAYPYFVKRLMEDNDPQLRKSLKEMLFDGQAFKWERLEDLMNSAGKKGELDIDTVVDEVLDFIFSANGKMLRKELVISVTMGIDNVAWNTIKKVNGKLPKPIQSKRIGTAKDNQEGRLAVKSDPIKEVVKILKTLPTFNQNLIIKRLPRIILEPGTIRMGLEVTHGVTERGIIRLIKIAAGVQQ